MNIVEINEELGLLKSQILECIKICPQLQNCIVKTMQLMLMLFPITSLKIDALRVYDTFERCVYLKTMGMSEQTRTLLTAKAIEIRGLVTILDDLSEERGLGFKKFLDKLEIVGELERHMLSNLPVTSDKLFGIEKFEFTSLKINYAHIVILSSAHKESFCLVPNVSLYYSLKSITEEAKLCYTQRNFYINSFYSGVDLVGQNFNSLVMVTADVDARHITLTESKGKFNITVD